MLHQSLQSSRTLGQFFERLYVLWSAVGCLLTGFLNGDMLAAQQHREIAVRAECRNVSGCGGVIRRIGLIA